MEVRVVIQSTSDGEEQYMNFTSEIDRPQKDFIFPYCSIDVDEIIEMDLLPGFPLEYSFKRV